MHVRLAVARTHPPGEGQLQQEVCGNVDEPRDGAATQPRRPTAATTPVGSRGSPVARWHALRSRLPKGLRQHIVDGAPALAGAVGVTAVRAPGAIAWVGAVPVKVEGRSDAGCCRRCTVSYVCVSIKRRSAAAVRAVHSLLKCQAVLQHTLVESPCR